MGLEVPEGSLMLFGIAYPRVAGLDAERQTLYFNLCALLFLALAAAQLAIPPPRNQHQRKTLESSHPGPERDPAA